MASFTTGPNGQIIAAAGPPLHTPAAQTITGGPINAAAAKTMAAQAQQVEAAKALGAGQKGSSRRRRRHRGGASNLNASIPFMPTANSIPGVSAENNHLNSVNNLNQIRADKVYDALQNAPPVKMGGFLGEEDRTEGAEELYPMSGSQHESTRRKHKRRHRTSKKHGGRRHRTHRRGNRKSSTRSRRRHRSVH
jgi:hypothetical protein